MGLISKYNYIGLNPINVSALTNIIGICIVNINLYNLSLELR